MKKVRKKKQICLLLILIGLLTLTILSNADNSTSSYESDTILNLDQDGVMLQNDKQTFKDDIISSNVTIENIIYSSNQIILSGIINNNENISQPKFNLVGTFENRGKENDSLVLINFEDTLDNYEIIHSSITTEPNKTNAFDKCKKHCDSLFKLYLLEKNTRHLTILEIEDPIFLDINEIISNYASYETAKKEDILWHRKLIKTSSFTIKEDNTIYGYHPTEDYTKSFSQDYSFMGEDYSEYMKVKMIVESTSSLSYSEEMGAAIQIVDEKTTSPNDSTYNENETFFSVGCGSSTTIDVILEEDSNNKCGDGFKKVQIDWQGKKSPKIKVGPTINLGWSYKIPHSPISFSVSIDGSKDIDFNESYESFANDIDDELCRRLNLEMNKEYMLEDIGDKFTADFNVHKYDSVSRNNQKLKAKFSFGIWNGVHNREETRFTKTLTEYYTSN